nr:MAG TPA: hypothetical protein [Caudoviricetes sp.]
MMISLSVRERPFTSYHGLSTHRIDTYKFHGSFRIFLYYLPMDFISTSNTHIVFCHTATLTNFLCYTLISQIQGKSAYLRFPVGP